jgi:hypothetical protein
MSRQFFTTSLITVSSLISFASYGQFTDDVKLWYNLHGKVRSCITVSYNMVKQGYGLGKQVTSFDSAVFNKKGQLIKAFRSNTVRGADINKRVSTVYKYDSKGNLAVQWFYNINGEAEAKLVYNYSTTKKQVKLKIYYLKEKESSRVTDTYNINTRGQVLKRYHYNESFVPDVKYQYGTTVYKYNAKGLRTEELSYGLNDTVTAKRYFKYNSYNDQAEFAYVWLKDERDNNTMIFTYPKYDKNGNWLVRNRIINGKLHSVDERYFIFYE